MNSLRGKSPRRVLMAATLVALAMLSVPAAANATRYAAPAATGTGDCSTPANACTLPTALGMPPDEIVLATGDYGSSGAPLPSFQITPATRCTGRPPARFPGSSSASAGSG